MEHTVEEMTIVFEEVRQQIEEIIDNKDINSYFLFLFLLINFSLIKQLNAEEFYDKFCKIYKVIKNNKKLNEIFDLNNGLQTK